MNPKTMGFMTLRIRLDGNKLKGRITVESPEAAGMLKDNLNELVTQFREQGFEIEEFDIESLISDDTGQGGMAGNGRSAQQLLESLGLKGGLGSESENGFSAGEVARAGVTVSENEINIRA